VVTRCQRPTVPGSRPWHAGRAKRTLGSQTANGKQRRASTPPPCPASPIWASGTQQLPCQHCRAPLLDCRPDFYKCDALPVLSDCNQGWTSPELWPDKRAMAVTSEAPSIGCVWGSQGPGKVAAENTHDDMMQNRSKPSTQGESLVGPSQVRCKEANMQCTESENRASHVKLGATHDDVI
jgi:hypothetical protein